MDHAVLMPNDVGLNESVRSSRSRIASLSSLLGHDSSFTKSDKLGIRKLAKACSKSLAAWNDNSSKRTKSVENSEEPTTLPDYEESQRVPYPTLFTTRRDKKIPTIEKDWKNYFDLNDNKSRHNLVFHPAPTTEDAFDTTKMKASISRFIEKKSKATIIESNDNIVTLYGDQKPTYSTIENTVGRRVVQIKDFTSFVSLKAVLSQISGGPLEKIVLLYRSDETNQNSKHQLKNNILELWFLNPEDAESFMHFSSSGMFLINGLHYNPQWAPANNYTSDLFHAEPNDGVNDEMVNNGASRCLILKKFINKKVKSSSSRHYPSPRSHLSELNVDQIFADFRQFGDIVEISPVISRKLCVAIHFFSTESAIRAKKLFEEKDSSFHQKYEEWSLWYGKDPTDKPCINI